MPVCERHKEETLLRCGRCEKPICPQCTVHGPAGARCPDCGTFRSSHLFQIAPGRLAASAGACAAAVALAAYILAGIRLGIFGSLLQAFIFIMLTMAYLNGAVGAEEH